MSFASITGFVTMCSGPSLALPFAGFTVPARPTRDNRNGCCQLLLRLLGVFLLLVLVHLRFFHSVSCGWLPLWGSSAGYSFPNGRPYGKRSSSSSRPGGRRRFIGVRGAGSFFRAFGFPEVGAVSFPDPFRRLSVPPLAGLEGQGCGDLSCRGAAAGLLSALPQHSSSSIVPIPLPSSSPISITGAALEEITLGLIAKDALELAPLPSPGFYSHLFVVWKTSRSWRPVIDLSHLNRFVDVPHFQMETIQSVLLSVRQGDWMASIDLKEAYLQVPVHPASRHFLRFMFRGTVYQFKALCFGLSTAPQVFIRVMAPVSAILLLWVSVCVDTSTTGWSSLPLGSLSLRICRLSSNFVKNWGLSSTPRSPTSYLPK